MEHTKKKSLGQHFLRSTRALSDIITAGRLAPNEHVLEIGPGEGVLTKALLDRGAFVHAIEKDRSLIPILQETFAPEIAAKKFFLTEADILALTPEELGFTKNAYKLIANIPYYITGAIIEKFLTEKNHPSCMVLLIQKEVAERIVARDGKHSILSIAVHIFGTPHIVAKVPRGAFVPPPNVDSAIIAIENISHEYFTTWKQEESLAIKSFFDVIHAGFAHKRKFLARNLEEVAQATKIGDAFTSLGLASNTRAEDVSISEWKELARLLIEG
jgi:16S rRNA (adenine1518-N6/adenine1519-N6)-dimethyltransferase